MDELLQNLLFVVVALVAWGVKAVLERKERAGGATRRPPRAGGPRGPRPAPAPPSSGEVDVVYGRHPLPEALAPRPRPQLPAPATATSESLGPESAVGADSVLTLGAARLKPLAKGGTASLDVMAAMHKHARRMRPRRAAALRRLGVGSGTSARQVLRAAVLWSEVLGVPRALAGPHRAPAVRRLTRR